jgi:hypothetical protein
LKEKRNVDHVGLLTGLALTAATDMLPDTAAMEVVEMVVAEKASSMKTSLMARILRTMATANAMVLTQKLV